MHILPRLSSRWARLSSHWARPDSGLAPMRNAGRGQCRPACMTLIPVPHSRPHSHPAISSFACLRSCALRLAPPPSLGKTWSCYASAGHLAQAPIPPFQLCPPPYIPLCAPGGALNDRHSFSRQRAGSSTPCLPSLPRHWSLVTGLWSLGFSVTAVSRTIDETDIGMPTSAPAWLRSRNPRPRSFISRSPVR